MSTLALLSILLTADTPESAAAAERALKSVVSVSTVRFVRERESIADRLVQIFTGDDGSDARGPTPRERVRGSAVVLSNDGILVTSGHVVDRAESIIVRTANGRELAASVVAVDLATDLAVLRVELNGARLTAIELGDSARLRVGDPVLTIGDSFGLGLAVSAGVVSAKGRTEIGAIELEDLIQTDAAINPGDSGGALIDMRGRLVGINAAIVTNAERSEGVGFAVPIEVALPIALALIEGGAVERGYLGASVQALEARLRGVIGANNLRGVVINDVALDSPAFRAGLAVEDVIVALDGRRIEHPGAFENAIASKSPGTRIELEVSRAGAPRRVSVALAERPGAAEPRGEVIVAGRKLGAKLVPLDRTARELFGIEPRVTKGIVVADLDAGGVAALAGLSPGDVILEMDRRAVEEPAAVERAWRAADHELLLRVVRSGRAQLVVLTPPGAAEVP